jgi:hypothetical protein
MPLLLARWWRRRAAASAESAIEAIQLNTLAVQRLAVAFASLSRHVTADPGRR